MQVSKLILPFVLVLSACDVHKDDRKTEQQKLETAIAQVERLKSQIEDSERSIAKLEIEVKEAREDSKNNDSEYEKNKLELAKYSMDHKMAAAAAAGSAAGIAALFSDLDQNQKSAIAIPTVIATGYCLFNGSECAEVSTRIAYYGTQIALFKSKVTEAQNREANLKTAINAAEGSRQAMKAQAADLSAKIATLRERVHSLQCKFPICF